MTRKQLRIQAYANDLLLALNFYEWEFHDNTFCGWLALVNLALLICFSILIKATPKDPTR